MTTAAASSRGARSFGYRVRGTQLLLLVACFALLEVLCRRGTIDPLIVPAPTDVAEQVWSTVRTSQFYADLGRTALEVVLASSIGVTAGLAIGVTLWRFRSAGEALELYLATLYAIPVVVLYPILLALMGLGSGPIVTLSSIMVGAPVALSTMVGLKEIPPVLLKLGRSVSCTRRQLFVKVMVPAAMPLLAPGLRLGLTYGITGTVVMEFLLANRGLGYRIGASYNEFAILPMWAGIVIVVVLCVLVIGLLGVVVDRVRQEVE
ncbi:MAG TPA: ABC transporter permease [Conexibacter sp.]|nr:ABC transporter permease [Conexibacter sp.]